VLLAQAAPGLAQRPEELHGPEQLSEVDGHLGRQIQRRRQSRATLLHCARVAHGFPSSRRHRGIPITSERVHSFTRDRGTVTELDVGGVTAAAPSHGFH
jgi:hypothetical protein